ncbi:MAG: hypothetical protein K2X27_13085 [Candidatus Obscuribacterales bacterium]|nr:hypothetical protein [Candidatus Obscuribacterales bacterium]
MLFNSFTYLLFLPLVALLYWVAPARVRHLILLVASYIFYMSWMKVYGLLLFGLTAVNYLLGLLLARAKTLPSRRLVFIAGISINLFCLGLFKYTNFILESLRSSYAQLQHLFNLAALPAGAFSELPIILPLGISFFVFEFIHYLADVFKGAKPMVSPVRFGLFAAFFPSQIAGPIKRFQDFEEQLEKNAKFDKKLFNEGFLLIMQGMFKKVALGDNLAPLAQAGFAQPTAMGTFDTWVCVLAFALQIYYDFSGYTDIGRGSAMVLGFKLPENFMMPYSATSLRDFWHRWHISLSTWLRDYLYIPLGGSRKGKSAAAMNLLTTMLLGGLWHGASWHFVVWGAFHGSGLAVNRAFDSLIERVEFLKNASRTWWWTAMARVSTFILVCIGWVVFRANNMGEAMGIYQGMFTLRASSTVETPVSELFWQSTLPVSLVLYAVTYLALKYYPSWSLHLPESFRQFQAPVYARAMLLAGFALLVLGLAPQHSIPFIYFQF